MSTELFTCKKMLTELLEGKNGVGILVVKDLADQVVEVRRKSERIMAIKILVGAVFVNVVSVYAPQVGLPEETKKLFWRILMRSPKRSLGARNCSSEEILMAISVRRQRVMTGFTGA